MLVGAAGTADPAVARIAHSTAAKLLQAPQSYANAVGRIEPHQHTSFDYEAGQVHGSIPDLSTRQPINQDAWQSNSVRDEKYGYTK